MVEDFLKDIYKKAMTIELIKEVKLSNDLRSVRKTYETWNRLLGYIDYIRDDLKVNDPDMLYDLLACIQATRNFFGNRSLFSSSLETGVIPRLMRYMSNYTGIDVTEGKWTLESAQTGYLTIHNEKGVYLHSTSDPMWEAYLLARDIYDPDVSTYRILGGGLGYLPYQLWRLSEGAADIFIYETDKKLIEYADLYGVLSYIDSVNLHVIHKDNPEDVYFEFLEPLKEQRSYKNYVYCWKYEDYDGEYIKAIDEFILNEGVTREFARKWDLNYEKNSELDHKNVSELDPNRFAEEWVIVAAGPSVDENEDFIRESIGRRTICTVNTSIRWFNKKKLRSDICVACDPFDQLADHIVGMEESTEGVPLIADAVTNWRFMKLYRGEKYYVLSSSSVSNKARAEDMEYDFWTFGGTVADMALCTALKMGAKKIYLIGVDLAYPGGKNYSENMSHKIESGISSGVMCASVEDTEVQTSETFVFFKGCIEAHVLDSSEVKIINKSKHGAYIKGTFCDQWWEKNGDLSTPEEYIDYLSKLGKDSLILGWREKYYILWQTLHKMIENGVEMTNQLRKTVTSEYRKIYETFKTELDWTPTPGVTYDPGQIFVFTGAFYNGKDPMSRKVLKCAKSVTKKGKNALIVNTAEYLGGEFVATEERTSSEYDKSLENAEVVFYENKPYAYYQFPDCMPDLDYIKEFLEFVDLHRPAQLIKLNEYSLLADFCSEFIPTALYDGV